MRQADPARLSGLHVPGAPRWAHLDSHCRKWRTRWSLRALGDVARNLARLKSILESGPPAASADILGARSAVVAQTPERVPLAIRAAAVMYITLGLGFGIGAAITLDPLRRHN